jgi:hypothetical protein
MPCKRKRKLSHTRIGVSSPSGFRPRTAWCNVVANNANPIVFLEAIHATNIR